ncbi:hypothetical protein MLD38_014289 [Melastoma candidum]|uniref:Uncharacterized protein n=1 Tax=Melastoma candidum TaxID=119954 RepID=A0ACB9RCE4_9MYRT|nr:hypothetical protein MLD38_014289 [Melastoma candidum]
MDSAEPSFVIPEAQAESLAARSGLTVSRWLPSLVPSAKTLARPPISRYHVCAVGLGPSGRVFVGVNLEFPGLPLHHSVHAEQFLLTNMSLHSEPHLTHLAVSAAPCGHCRQFLQELRHSSDVQLLVSPEPDLDSSADGVGNVGHGPDVDFKPLPVYLPHQFGPHDLLSKNVPFLLEPHDNGLYLLVEQADNSSRSNGNINPVDYPLVQAALEAANASHSPYSNCPSGVALADRHGRFYKGSYAESAAFNPSMSPMQAAIVAYVAGGGGGYEGIVRGVLVEKEGVAVRQEETAKLFAKVVLPKCEFRVIHCGTKLGQQQCEENGGGIQSKRNY